MRLTGNESWVKAGLSGAVVWARKWGSGDWWWPIVHAELDTGLITVDVCGLPEIWHLDDCAQLRIEDDEPLDQETFMEEIELSGVSG
jgi:hypothetical protein